MITRMRPDPDFEYLARRVKQEAGSGAPLDRDLDRDPGEIPGFYAREQNE